MAKQAIEVWENVKAMIKWYKEQAPSQQPRMNSSYDTLLFHVPSKLVLVRLQFFHEIAMILNKSLVSPFYAFLLWESLLSLKVTWWMYYMFFSAW